MSSTSYNAQFLTIDFRLLEDPGYLEFVRSSPYALYLLLRRYIWRGVKRRHPIDQVNELYRQGYLVTAVARPLLARRLGLRNVANVSRQLTELVQLGVVRIFRTGRENVFILGTWEDRSQARDRSYLIEIFIVDQLFGAERFDQPRLGDVTPQVTSDVTPQVTSDVTPQVTSDVAHESHNNKEVNREANNQNRGLVGCSGEREHGDDVIYVEF